MNSSFNKITKNYDDYYPLNLRPEIDKINKIIYENINNGVYKSGFSKTQSAYEDAVTKLFSSLEMIDHILGGKEYLVGDFTAADTMLGHACFMSNRMGSVPEEMTNIKAYVKRLMERPAFKKAVIDPQ